MEKASMRSCHSRSRVSSASLEVPSKGRASAATSRKRPRTTAESDHRKGPRRIMSPTAFLWCLEVMDRLMKGPAARVFNERRGRARSRVLDFERVKYKLEEEGDYESADEFAEDVVLALTTAVELGSPSASGVLGMFETEWRQCRENLKPKKFYVKDRPAESVSSGVQSTVTHQSRSDDQKAASIRRSVERISDRYPATSTKSSITSSCSSRERPEYRSINSIRQLRRNDYIERQREAARRKIAAMTNTAGLTDNFESMIEFNKLLKGKSWSAQYVPCWS